MARILLIEQQVIIREAIRHFLFPEHVVVVSEEWPSAEKMLTHEAAIIDLETLSRLEQNPETVEALLAEAKIPTCWLSREGQPLPESEATRIVVQKPLDPQALGGRPR